MRYIRKRCVLAYIDSRLKDSSIQRETKLELQRLVKFITRTKEDDEARVAGGTTWTPMQYCTACNTIVGESDVFCHKCGRRLVRK